jgi:hypothetical protein
VTEPRRGRGRRDNGLDAALWSPVRDVDPRVGEHLLELLRDAGIAAYLEPSADVSPYTRTVYLPSPPSDRLFVDRARTSEARGLVERNADEHARLRPPVRRQLRPDLDEAAEWRRIVEALEAEQRTPVEAGDGTADGGADRADRGAAEPEPVDVAPPPPPPPAPAAAPAPAPAPAPVPVPVEPDPLEVEEHFEPPPPPPLRAPAPASLYALLLIAAGALLVFAPQVLGLSGDLAVVLGVGGVAAGVAVLVSRMRERSTEDGDDGAVV